MFIFFLNVLIFFFLILWPYHVCFRHARCSVCLKKMRALLRTTATSSCSLCKECLGHRYTCMHRIHIRVTLFYWRVLNFTRNFSLSLEWDGPCYRAALKTVTCVWETGKTIVPPPPHMIYNSSVKWCDIVYYYYYYYHNQHDSVHAHWSTWGISQFFPSWITNWSWLFFTLLSFCKLLNRANQHFFFFFLLSMKL